MIEHIRKYTGLIIVLFVLVIIGFVFMDTSTMRAAGSGQPYIKIGSRKYTDKEYLQLGANSFELAQYFTQAQDFNMMMFTYTLAGDPGAGKAEEQFFINRILLRRAKEEFGIHPSEDEIDTFIRQLPAFSGMDGAFSQESYSNFIEKRIGRLGLTEGDLRNLAADVIAQQKLTEILGSGLIMPEEIVAKQNALQNQRIDVEVARIDAAPIEESIEVTEEEIKAYWETIQDAFRTEEKRKFTYFVVGPEAPEDPATIPALADDATEEQKAEFEKKVSEREATISENKRTAQLTIDEKVDDFLFQLEEDKSATFESLAEKNEWELETTELVTATNAPEAIKSPLRATSSQGTAANVLFQMNITSDPYSRLSPAIAIGENKWLVARLDEVEESRVMTFEEARDEARARLIADKTEEALRAAAEKAAETISTAMKEGESFSEAAVKAEITESPVKLDAVSRSTQNDTAKVPFNLFRAAMHTAPGELAEPVIEDDCAFLIHVSKREVEKDENAAELVKQQVERGTDANRINVFANWLTTQAEEAGVETLYNQ